MTPNQDLIVKLTAAREAVDKAAADLLAHAEGLGMLVMMERIRARHEVEEQTYHPLLDAPATNRFIRNTAAERAHAGMVEAAAALVGHQEALTQATQMWEDPWFRAMLRNVVEQVIGPGHPPPPPVKMIAERMRDAFPEVTPSEVHEQAWRNRLMSSAAIPADRT